MGEVLYGDYNGHLRPLSSMYFSLDSRCLVADHPESVQEEVESHYCPHCNSLFTTPDAMSTENRCPQCFECPCCRCVLVPSPVSLGGPPSPPSSSPAAAPPSYCLRCLYCQWTSEGSGLVAPDPVALAEAASAAAREEKESGGGSAEVVGALLKAAKKQEAEAGRGGGGADGRGGSGGGGRGARPRAGSVKSVGRGGSGASPFSAMSAGASAVGPWKVADLEEAVALRNQAVAAASRSPAPPPQAASASAGHPVLPWDLEADTDGPDPALWTLANRHQALGLAERLDLPSPPPLTIGNVRGTSGSGGGGEGGGDGGGSGSAGARGTGRGRPGGGACRSPPRVRLRTRIGKRCRKDLAAGRTGILIKATFNPLEGDSSTANKGVKKKWFKKDCSAALLVPRITVAALPSRLALLGPTATAEREDPNKEGRKEGSVHACQAPASPGVGDGTEAGGAQRRRQPQPSLVLRVVNPQQDTVVRVRVAAEDPATAAASSGGGGGDETVTAMPSSTVEGAGEPEGGQAALQTEENSRGSSVSLPGEQADAGRAPATPMIVSLRAVGWDQDDWVRLEGKEDEVLRQPGDRHRLPHGALLPRAGDVGDGSLLPGDEEGRNTGATGKAPFLLHQQGDVAWVRVPIDGASAERVAAVAGASARASLVVDMRFFFVMGEGEGGEGDAGGGDVSMPIAVRFPLSSCPE